MSTTDGTKHLKTPVIPPAELLVQKFTESRASELDSLYSTISTRLNNDFKSHRSKRRRTTGFDNRGSKTRFRKKQKVGALNNNKNNNENLEKDVNKAPPRHIRRKKELYKNPESGFGTSGDGTKRLRTHVWYAKRFTMTKRWGFHLPLGLHGRYNVYLISSLFNTRHGNLGPFTYNFVNLGYVYKDKCYKLAKSKLVQRVES